jgi:threonine dehydratase
MVYSFQTFVKTRERKSSLIRDVIVYAATDGNHGRAVARMGLILSIPVVVHVPSVMHKATIKSIQEEGSAKVIVSTGNYDDAVLEAQHAAKQTPGGILVQDFAFDGYEDIPTASLGHCPFSRHRANYVCSGLSTVTKP